MMALPAGRASRPNSHSPTKTSETTRSRVVSEVFVEVRRGAGGEVGGLLGGPLTKRASASTLTTAFGLLLLGVCAVTAYDLLTF